MPGIDEIGGTPVLVGQPVVGQVEIDPGRLDGDVAGLGLDGLQSHARFPQSGQTGVAELVTGRSLEPGPLSGTPHDYVDPVSSETVTPARALQCHEDPVGRAPAGRSKRR